MRALLLLLAFLPLLPEAGAAQLDPQPVRHRWVLNAFTGVRVPYSTGFAQVTDLDGNTLFSVSEQRGGNAVLGVEGEMHAKGPVSVLAGGVFTRTGVSDFFVDRGSTFRDTADFRIAYTGNTWFAKLGASVRLQELARPGDTRRRPATDVYAAGALVRQLDANHPALNFGFRGAFPVGERGVEFTLGAEDYLVFWNKDDLAPELSRVLQPGAGGEPVAVSFLYDTSNVLLLRAGVSFRF